MKKKNVKPTLAIMILIVMLFTALPGIVIANDLTENEMAYGRLCLGIIKEVLKLSKSFDEAVKANDLETMIVISTQINNTFEPHYQVSSPSKLFDKLYYYMESSADAATSIPNYLLVAYHHGNRSGLVNANKQLQEMRRHLVDAAKELNAIAEAQKSQRS